MRTNEIVSRKAFANNTFRRVAKVLQTFQAPLSYLAVDPRYFQVWKISQSLTFAFSVYESSFVSDWVFISGVSEKDITSRKSPVHTRTHTHTHIFYVYIYIYKIYQEVIKLMQWKKCQTTTITLCNADIGIISKYKIKVYKWNEHHPIRSN